MRGLALTIAAVALLTGCPRESKEIQVASSEHISTAATEDIAGGAPDIAIATSDAMPSVTTFGTPLADSPRRSVNDANADGRSDLIWLGMGEDGFLTAYWVMEGTRPARTLGPSSVVHDIEALHHGDFDGDRRVDQLWFTQAGQLILARLNEAGWLEQSAIAQIAPGWFPEQVVDLNGDGKHDIVWVDEERGLLAYWLMNGSTILSTRLYSTDTRNYRIYTSGDFDGDGRGDLLWMRSRAAMRDNALYLWRSRSDGHFDQLFVGSVGNSWTLDAVVDLNGDSRSDLVWTNESSGQLAYWWMNGATLQRSGVFSIDSAKYLLVASGDFDGDGKGDIVWSSRPGEGGTAQLHLWRSRGDGSFDASYIASYDGANWQPFPAAIRD